MNVRYSIVLLAALAAPAAWAGHPDNAITLLVNETGLNHREVRLALSGISKSTARKTQVARVDRKLRAALGDIRYAELMGGGLVPVGHERFVRWERNRSQLVTYRRRV